MRTGRRDGPEWREDMAGERSDVVQQNLAAAGLLLVEDDLDALATLTA